MDGRERIPTGTRAVVLIILMATLVAGCSVSERASPNGSPSGPPGSEATKTAGASPEEPADPQAWLDELALGTGVGAVALVESPGKVWRGASGTAGDGQPPDPSDAFPIISTTKTFTAAVVLQLVGEGRVALDDSVERWLPGQVETGEQVTIRQLLNHTSGLGGQPNQHHYANENYDILARLVEVVTGDSFDAVLRDRIFLPLGLEHTTVTTLLTHPEIEATTWLGEPAHVTSPPTSGAMGIVSTTADVATFFGALLGGEVLADRELSEMLTTVDAMTDVDSALGAGTNAGAGLGIFSVELPCGVAWGHGGEGNTYSNYVFASEDGSRIVIVAQNRRGWPLANATAAEMFCHNSD